MPLDKDGQRAVDEASDMTFDELIENVNQNGLVPAASAYRLFRSLVAGHQNDLQALESGYAKSLQLEMQESGRLRGVVRTLGSVAASALEEDKPDPEFVSEVVREALSNVEGWSNTPESENQARRITAKVLRVLQVSTVLLAIVFAGCGPAAELDPDAGPALVEPDPFALTATEADTCCACLEANSCLVSDPNVLTCREALEANYAPIDWVTACTAGEPGDVPRGVCADACPWL